MDQLYELWDVNASGYLELDEIQVVLNKWRVDGIDNFKQGLSRHFFLWGGGKVKYRSAECVLLRFGILERGGGRLGLFCPMFVTQERFLSLLFCVVF